VPIAAVVGLLVGAGGVGIAWGLSSGSSSSSGPPFTLHGTLTLKGSNVATGADYTNCEGSDGFDDIVEGAQVTVYDIDTKIVAVGSLGVGKSDGKANCVFEVTVPGVPRGSKFYQVEISHRGKLQVSEAEAQVGLFAASLN
jgi:hypothetical protein